MPLTRSTVAVNAAARLPTAERRTEERRLRARCRRRSSSPTAVSPPSSTTSSRSRARRRCSTGSPTRSAELVPHHDLHIYEADDQRRELLPVFAGRLVGRGGAEQPDRLRPGDHRLGGRPPQPGARERRAPRPARLVRSRARPPDPEALITRSADRPRLAEGRPEHLPRRRGRLLRRRRVRARPLVRRRRRARARQRADPRAASSTWLTPTRSPASTTTGTSTSGCAPSCSRAGRAHDTVALLMLDIDDFKRVNDVCGHGEGDQVLQQLADVLRATVRGSDTVCRVGGEEFAVILPSCSTQAAVGARGSPDGGALLRAPAEAVGEVTLSIGVAFGPEHAMNARELVACAEAAMMTAKAQGKDRVVVFEDVGAERPARRVPRARDVRSIAYLKMLQSLAQQAEPAERRHRDRRGDRRRAADAGRLPQLLRLPARGRRLRAGRRSRQPRGPRQRLARAPARRGPHRPRRRDRKADARPERPASPTSASRSDGQRPATSRSPPCRSGTASA